MYLDDDEVVERSYFPFRAPLWRVIFQPLALRREAEEKLERLAEFDRLYPNGLTEEQWRRRIDLGDPFAEYGEDDPRKYGYYGLGTRRYSPRADEAPYRRLAPDPYEYDPDPPAFPQQLTREEFRRLADLGEMRDHYFRDDPRRYGIYGKGTFGYQRQPDDVEDGQVLRVFDEQGHEHSYVVAELTNEQFRRLIDLGDPEGEYAEDDAHRFGIYDPHWPEKINRTDLEVFYWEG